MLKKLGRKLKKGLKKAGPMIGLLGAAALAAKARKKDQGALTADMDRSMVPMSNRMVQGLNFPASTDLSGIDKIAAAGGVANLKKGGRVGCGKAKRGFGRALRKK
mgnify:CR=1 FL=1|jgi:hypothetical protein|tara:strand:+ start:1287 stop:1601 length:315 start_codon:yes stop_codon:yes gene_type:complete